MSLIPMMSIRDTVLFPGSTLTIIVGRPFTIATLKNSLASFNGQFVVTSQKFVEINERPSTEEIFTTGCLCRIVKHIELPDESMKLVIEAESRFKVEKITDQGDLRYCEGSVIAAPTKDFVVPAKTRTSLISKILENKKEWENSVEPYIEKLNSTKEDYPFLMVIGNLLTLRRPVKKERTIEQIREGIFFFDILTDKEKERINHNIARIQEVLEADDAKGLIRKLEALI